MSIITIHPKDKQEWLEARLQDITSTEVSALFGISPYLTEFELWYQKKEKNIVELDGNERMKWGNLLESAIANGIAKEQGWKIRPMKEYIREDSLRCGSSFDFCIEGPATNSQADIFIKKAGLDSSKAWAKGILEIKNVDSLVFKNTWEDGEPPLHIQLQVQHQLLVSGFSYAYVGALIGGNNLHLIKQERNEKVIEGIKKRVAKFWESIDNNIPPEPNFSTDSEFIASLYGYAEPGKFKDLTEDEEAIKLIQEYKEVTDQAKIADKKKKELKAKLLTIIDDAEKAIGNGFSISAGLIAPTWVEAYERKGFRNFRVNFSKGKK